jgi:hypothetical protein
MNEQGLVIMPKDEIQQHRGAVGKFDAGGELGPNEDRNEFERRLDALPPDQKELAQENARFADLCRYSSDKKMDIPAQVSGPGRKTCEPPDCGPYSRFEGRQPDTHGISQRCW